MAKIYISEHVESRYNSAEEPPLAEQAFTFSASTQSVAFHVAVGVIRVHTDSVCSIKIGENPTATTDNKRMAANSTEYFAVRGGHKLAAVTNT